MPSPTERVTPADLDISEGDMIALWLTLKEQCSNTHAAHRELAIAMTAFEDGFRRLRRALDPPAIQWPVRHQGEASA